MTNDEKGREHGDPLNADTETEPQGETGAEPSEQVENGEKRAIPAGSESRQLWAKIAAVQSPREEP